MGKKEYECEAGAVYSTVSVVVGVGRQMEPGKNHLFLYRSIEKNSVELDLAVDGENREKIEC